MTMIRVDTLKGRFHLEERKLLAQKLTDAVLIPEIGHFVEEARIGFQVVFTEYDPEYMAVSGKLLSDLQPVPDNINVNILVMDGAWSKEVRATVLENIANALAEVSGGPEPLNSWKVTLQIIDEGSWGTGKGVLSIFDLFSSGVFTPEKMNAIRENLSEHLN